MIILGIFIGLICGIILICCIELGFKSGKIEGHKEFINAMYKVALGNGDITFKDLVDQAKDELKTSKEVISK